MGQAGRGMCGGRVEVFIIGNVPRGQKGKNRRNTITFTFAMRLQSFSSNKEGKQ